MNEDEYKAIEQEIKSLEHRIGQLEHQLDEEDNQYRWAIVRGVPGSPFYIATEFNLVEVDSIARNAGQTHGQAVRFFKSMRANGWMEVALYVDKPEVWWQQ